MFGDRYLDEVLIFDKDSDDDGDCTENEGNGSTRHLYCTNNNYNVLALTDATGAVVERIAYDPYGTPTVTQVGENPATGNPWLFQGQRYCSETGLYYFKNRDLLPPLGRFVQRDPSGYVDGMSLCQYVSSNPTTLLDPQGLRSPRSCTFVKCLKVIRYGLTRVSPGTVRGATAASGVTMAMVTAKCEWDVTVKVRWNCPCCDAKGVKPMILDGIHSGQAVTQTGSMHMTGGFGFTLPMPMKVPGPLVPTITVANGWANAFHATAAKNACLDEATPSPKSVKVKSIKNPLQCVDLS